MGFERKGEERWVVTAKPKRVILPSSIEGIEMFMAGRWAFSMLSGRDFDRR
jgi:hypothetical protein